MCEFVKGIGSKLTLFGKKKTFSIPPLTTLINGLTTIKVDPTSDTNKSFVISNVM